MKTDQETVLKLHVEGLHQFHAYFDHPDLDQDLLNIEEHYMRSGGDFLILELDQQVIGMGGLKRKNADTAEIKRLRIRSDHQQRGYGKRMLMELEQAAKNLGYKQIVLDTTIHQIPAQKLFVKCGYVETGRRSYKGLDIMFYKKDLLQNEG